MFIGESEDICNQQVRQFIDMCEYLNCPIAVDKTEWASTQMVFLGILLNGVTHTLSVPENKKIQALNLLELFI